MAGFTRPIGGWTFSCDGLNVLDEADAINPTQYPYLKNVRGLAERSIRSRPGYNLFSSSPHITTSCPLATGQVGTAYSVTLTATGGIAPYTWSVLSGSLPSGLTLSSSGVLSGTPTLSGLFSFTFLVTDAAGGTDALACTLYMCPTTAGNSDWSGCLSGSFTNPSDWVTTGQPSLSGGLATFTSGGGSGFARHHTGGCGSSLNQEVYAVYNTKAATVGNRGFLRLGIGCRMSGTIAANFNGYFFTAAMWGGDGFPTCSYNGFILLQINKVVASANTVLTSTSIAGPDLTPGIPFDFTCTVEGSGARCVGYLGGTQMLSVLDSSSVLGAGEIGLASLDSCTGTIPTSISFSFIKARNL